MPNALNKLDAFAGGVDAEVVATVPAAAALTIAAMAAPVPHINGAPAGEPAEAAVWVHPGQLVAADPADTLYSQYKAATDPHLQRHAAALKGVAPESIPALLVLPTGQAVPIGGELRPVFAVYHDPALFAALVAAGAERIKIRIPAAANPGEVMYAALVEHEWRRPPSTLERCDTALRLYDTWGFTQEQIARALPKEKDATDAPSQGTVSTMIAVARLPRKVRGEIHLGRLPYTHATHIAKSCGRNPALAELVCRWVLDTNATARGTQKALNDAVPPPPATPSAQFIERNGQVYFEPIAISLVNDRPRREQAPLTYTPTISSAAAVRMAQRSLTFQTVAHPDKRKAGVTAQSLVAVADWLADREGVVPFADAEAYFLGVLEALHQAAVATQAIADLTDDVKEA